MTRETDDAGTEIRVDLLLDEATRQARLWDRAKGRPGRVTFEDVAALAMIAVMVALVFWRGVEIPSGLLLLMLPFFMVQQWHTQRLRRRLDAIVRLLEQSAAKRV